MVNCGYRLRSNGGGAFDEDDDSPLPKRFGMMMKYFSGSNAVPVAIMNSMSMLSAEGCAIHDRVASFGIEFAVRLVREPRSAIGEPRLQYNVSRLEHPEVQLFACVRSAANA